jgi:cell division protein FtsZ
VPGIINVDFKDIETTMKDSGTAVMGSAFAKGDDRAMKAVTAALSSPLLNNNEIEGATKVLLAITYGHAPELTMDEFYMITDYIQQRTGKDADVIFGTTMDAELGDAIQVTVVATGFHKEHALGGHFSGHHAGTQVHVLTERPGVDTHFGQPVQAPVPPAPAQPEYNPYQQPPRPGYQPAPSYQPPAVQPVEAQYIPPAPAPSPQPPVYQAPAPEPARPEPAKPGTPQGEEFQVVDINGNFQLMYQSPENVDRPLENVEEMLSKRPDFANRINRAEILRNLSANAMPRPNYDDPDYLKQNELPAYLRRGGQTPAGNENMSRLTINENNEILDNNRYFNPKVD